VKVIGVIAEFNPLHYGHAWLLRQIKNSTTEQCGIITIMPEFFSQRGIPNLLAPWQRAQTALVAGADLVLSLPEVYALSSAEGFAAGSVKSLASTGLISEIACSAEDADITKIEQISNYLSTESYSFQRELQQGIKNGIGFAAAREQALANVSQDTELASLINKPNNILAIEYMKALNSMDKSHNIKLKLYPRLIDTSSGSIRKHIEVSLSSIDVSDKSMSGSNQLLQLIKTLEDKLPPYSLSQILTALQLNNGPLLFEKLKDDIFYALYSQDTSSIQDIAHMQQGLGLRLINLAGKPQFLSLSMTDFVQVASSRAHPASRVRRALLSLLLGMRTSDLYELREPEYLKVMGFNKKGRYLLRLMNRHGHLPIISLASEYAKLKSKKAQRQSNISLRAAKLWFKQIERNINIYYEKKPIQL